MDLVHDLTGLVRDNLTEGVTIHLEHLRYVEEYRKPPIPKRMSLDSQYGVCFRACMAHLIAIVLRDGKKHLLDVEIEGGHKNVGDTVRIFEDMKALVRRRLNTELLRNIRVMKKQDAPPLMLADFIAYTYSGMRASKASGGLDYDAEAPIAPPKREAGLTHLELLPEALRGLKEAFERERREAVDAWRARRDAQQFGSAGIGPRLRCRSRPRLAFVPYRRTGRTSDRKRARVTLRWASASDYMRSARYGFVLLLTFTNSTRFASPA